MSCLDCKWSDDSVRRNGNIKCTHPESPWKWCAIDISCRRFTAKPPTIFHQITASPEVLAARSVYAHENCRIPDGATSPFIDKIFWFDDEKGDTWDERFDRAWEKAIAATVAKLKETAK